MTKTIAILALLLFSLGLSAKDLNEVEKNKVSEVKKSLQFNIEQFTVAQIMSKANFQAYMSLQESNIYTLLENNKDERKELSTAYLGSKNCEEIKKYTYNHSESGNNGFGYGSIFTNIYIVKDLFNNNDARKQFLFNGQKAIEALISAEENCKDLEVASQSIFQALTELRDMLITLNTEFK